MGNMSAWEQHAADYEAGYRKVRWQTGRPPEHGYYLGAWMNNFGKWVVSELWFNPDSFGSGWWTDRAYFHERSEYPASHTPLDTVAAWMPKPEYTDD